MSGVLLDTHALLWLEQRLPLKGAALFAIADSRSTNALFVSAISAWELGVALRKTKEEKRPQLDGIPIDHWFPRVIAELRAKVVPVTQKIALEAAHVPEWYGYGDPGDCFLIATARVRNLTLITRDRRILNLAHLEPDYLTVIEC